MNRSDSGMYVVTATNVAGMATANFTLDVQCECTVGYCTFDLAMWEMVEKRKQLPTSYQHGIWSHDSGSTIPKMADVTSVIIVMSY